MNASIKTGFLFLSFFFLVLIYHSPAMAYDEETPDRSDTNSQKEKSGFNFGAAFISIYRDHISAVDFGKCPSIPSCSSYSVQAFKKHGFFLGWMMMVDRLIHEGSEETKVSPIVRSHGEWKIYDPVENNDFWWYPEENKPSK
jgi:putative component of membrane protein insertase Oxa1/YidC/SpoIIIJ protein YidD